MAPKSVAKKRAATAAVKKAVQEQGVAEAPTISTSNTSNDINSSSEPADTTGTRGTSPTSSSAGSASISNNSSDSIDSTGTDSTGTEGVDAKNSASKKKNQKRREAAKRNKSAATTTTVTKPATTGPTSPFEIDSVGHVEQATLEGESFELSPDENNNKPLQTTAIIDHKEDCQQQQELLDQLLDIGTEIVTAENVTLPHTDTMSMPPLGQDNSMQPEGWATIDSQPDNMLEVDDQSSAPSSSEVMMANLLTLDNIKPTHDSLLPSQNKLDITSTLILDGNQEPSVDEYDITLIPGMQPRRPTAASAALSSAVHDFPPLASVAIPTLTAATLAEAEIGPENQNEAYENKDENEMTVLEPNQFHSWKVASERVVSGAIQCLTETKDMELSYVSLLSIITVLNSRHDQEGLDDGEVVVTSIEPAETIETDDPVGKLYAQLLKILTLPSVAESLVKETLRQGVLSPDALYTRLYKAILNAGYHLQDEDHVCLAQFLFDRQNTEDALFCLTKVDSTRWPSHIYRLAISCHLFTKPRHLHEAEILLDQYFARNKSLSSSSSSSLPSTTYSNQARPGRGSRSSSDMKREQFNKSLIQTWFQQQLDASKWDEIKTQYERRRARLLDAPSNIERFSAVMLDKDNLSIGSGVLSGQNKGGSSVSYTSVVAEPGSVASDSAESSAAAAGAIASTTASTSTPSEPSAPAITPPKRSSFSFFSAFRSSKPTTAAPIVPSIQTRVTNDMSRQSAPTSASAIQVNRHLTILDNGMLEECVNHKQFEYGWSIYERMGSLLEDKDTAKIAMRLCKRAFLGHGGLGPNLPGSPSVLTKDVYFEDEVATGSASTEQGDARTGTGSGSERSKAVQEDPEIWEARAWVIYNKAMMNPYFLNSTGSPSSSPTQPQSPGVTTTIASSASATGVNRGNGSMTSPVSSMVGTTALSVFLHNILTVAINSQEKSSRYLKAFRIYSTMRNDPLNHYQSQLRDPFVMTCMIKAIYDTVLILIKAQDQQRQQQQSLSSSATIQQQRASVSSLAPNQQPTQQMTIGPLIDLAFEIYADMRNVGPIRHLPRLSALAPTTPTPKTPQSTTVVPGVSGGSSMSIFFQLSSRAPASTSTAVDLSASSTNVATSSTTPATNNSGPSTTGPFFTPTTSSTSPSSSFPCTLQDLNPTLIHPNTLIARRLPTELYLALLHLCIQVPLSGVSVSSQVVKTIVADMVSTRPGQQPANLDRHLAAALQVFHDRWMCRAVELKGRKGCLTSSSGGGGDDGGLGRCGEEGEEEGGELDDLETEEVEQDSSDDEAEVEEGGCIFHGWMYRPEEYVLQHMASSSSSSSSSSSDLASDANSTNNTTTTKIETDELPCQSSEEKDSPFEVSKYDADLDELDRYLVEKKVGLSDGNGTERRGESEGGVANRWMEGLDHDTCNGRFYWDMWSREDTVLQEIRFSRRRARMLWRHVAEL